MKIPLSQPDITKKERDAVLGVLKTPNLALGPKLKEFEQNMAEFAGRKYAIATNSGTSGLHLAIKVLGVKKGDEVITSPFSFISSANCILFEQAKPVFVDIDPDTLNIDHLKIEKAITKKTKAMVIVDIFGHPVDWDPIIKIAKKHKLKIIEDSCEAIGAEYKGRRCGSFGEISTFAFYPNKQITSVRYNTPVLIKKNGITNLVKIGKLMDFMIDNHWKPEGYECLAFDKNGKISWRKIDTFIKHSINSEILKICLEKGRTAEITKSHSVFTIKNNKIEQILGKNLKIGDYLIVARKLPSSINPIKEIDILNYVQRENIKYDKKKVIIENNKVGGGGGKYINRKVKVNEKFCKLLGYFVAEGSYDLDKSGGGLRFTFGLHEKNTYVKEVKEIFDSIWPNFKINIILDKKNHKSTILCGGLLHSDLFKNLGCGKNVYEKNIPDVIWDTNSKNKLAFIEGLLNGDGHKRIINGSESRKIKVASENLANGLHYLLLTLGIQSRLENSKCYSKIGKLCYSYSCEILGFNNQKTSKENCIPVEFLSLNNNSSWVQKNRIQHKKSISIETLKKWIDKKQINCPKFLLENITVLKIKKIEKEKFHEFVYDFEVKGLQNFIGGYGAICLHNTGEGGIILADDEKIANYCRALTNQGRKIERGQWLNHSYLGYNYRMSDINASLGVAQLSRIKEILRKRDKVAKLYNKKLKNIKGVTLPYVAPYAKMSWFVYVIQVAGTRKYRDNIMNKLREQGVSCSNYFQCIHLQPLYKKMFGYKRGDFSIAEEISDKTIALPFYNNLTEKEIDYVVKVLIQSLI